MNFREERRVTLRGPASSLYISLIRITQLPKCGMPCWASMLFNALAALAQRELHSCNAHPFPSMAPHKRIPVNALISSCSFTTNQIDLLAIRCTTISIVQSRNPDLARRLSLNHHSLPAMFGFLDVNRVQTSPVRMGCR